MRPAPGLSMINATLALLAESVVPTLMLESPLPLTSGAN